MSARVERVRTDAGWHGRVIAENGEPIFTTEVLTDKRSVVEAVLAFGKMLGLDRALIQERRGEVALRLSDGFDNWADVRVVDIDEREAKA